MNNDDPSSHFVCLFFISHPKLPTKKKLLWNRLFLVFHHCYMAWIHLISSSLCTTHLRCCWSTSPACYIIRSRVWHLFLSRFLTIRTFVFFILQKKIIIINLCLPLFQIFSPWKCHTGGVEDGSFCSSRNLGTIFLERKIIQWMCPIRETFSWTWSNKSLYSFPLCVCVCVITYCCRSQHKIAKKKLIIEKIPTTSLKTATATSSAIFFLPRPPPIKYLAISPLSLSLKFSLSHFNVITILRRPPLLHYIQYFIYWMCFFFWRYGCVRASTAASKKKYMESHLHFLVFWI